MAFAAENSTLEPDNEYLAHTSEPGWAVLAALSDERPVLERLQRVREKPRVLLKGTRRPAVFGSIDSAKGCRGGTPCRAVRLLPGSFGPMSFWGLGH